MSDTSRDNRRVNTPNQDASARGGGASMPPTPVTTSTNPPDHSPVDYAQHEHATSRDCYSTVQDRTTRPQNHRRLTGLEFLSMGRPLHPKLPSSDQTTPPPNVFGKRPAASPFDGLAPTAKKQAKTSMTPEKAFARREAPVGPRSNIPASSSTGKQNPLPLGDMLTRAPDADKHSTPAANRTSPAEGMNPVSGGSVGVTSTRMPVGDATSARPDITPGLCRACGSRRHMTKECHVPSKDGTVPICPFHDCSVLDRSGQENHPLDGHTDHAPGDRLRAPLYCTKVMRYKMVVRTGSGRNMLPQMFEELVLNRKRKPCCRVLTADVCPVNIAIKYSLTFCHGKMPVEMQGVWPYTLRDATDPAVLARLERYDDFGWEGMPPGELEAKSWEQIKDEYSRGIIQPQTHSKHRPYYPSGAATPTPAEPGDAEPGEIVSGANLETEAVDEDIKDDEGQTSLEEESAIVAQDVMKIDVLHQIVGVLSEKVDALTEKRDVLYKILDSMP